MTYIKTDSNKKNIEDFDGYGICMSYFEISS